VAVTDLHREQVACLALTGPYGNALDFELLGELQKGLEAVARWPDLKAILIEGAGRDFSTGHSPDQLRPPFVTAVLEKFHDAIRTLVGLDVLVFSVVRGRCQGAGATLALAADIVLADNSARITLTDATGVPPPLTTLLLGERLDRARAFHALLTERVFTGEEAAGLQIVSEYAGGWDGLDAVVQRQLSQLVTDRPQALIQEMVRALRAPLRLRMADVLPDLLKGAIERLARRAEEPQTLPAKWRPGLDE
jgi:enoyl-CoA hydratase/carnithine racemase